MTSTIGLGSGPATAQPHRPGAAEGLALTCALLIGLVVAVVLRRVLAGPDPAGNPTAATAFAVLLAGCAAAAWVFGARWAWSGPVGWRALLLGLAAAAALCAGPLARHLIDPGGSLGLDRFWVWAAAVTAVAITEEAFLRGALWEAAAAWRGDWAALAVTTVAFAVLHVPFYGVGILPLDLAVGLLFGGLRMVTGGIAAATTAHLVADLAGWWLR